MHVPILYLHKVRAGLLDPLEYLGGAGRVAVRLLEVRPVQVQLGLVQVVHGAGALQRLALHRHQLRVRLRALLQELYQLRGKGDS